MPLAPYTGMNEPRRIWWARPGKLCLLERPGGGGRSHRPERRAADIDYLVASGVRVVISTMTTKHNLADYEAAGLEWHHVPVPDCAEAADALAEVLRLLRREMRRRGAVAVHGNRLTDFVAAVGAAWMRDADGADPAEALDAAKLAGLRPSEASAELLDVEWDPGRYEPIVRKRMASAAAKASA
jgi:hypothetical protein